MNESKIWSSQQTRATISSPTESDDKYSRGVLGVITGSLRYPGAALLNCTAAMETGLGMLRYRGPRWVSRAVVRRTPEVVLSSGRVSAWLIGSGIAPHEIGRRRNSEILAACKSALPLCLDAGGLHFITQTNPDGPTIITPHRRELIALFASRKIILTLPEIESDPMHWAVRASQTFGVTVLLKGHVTCIASPQRQIELPPAPAELATAGTGDVLAGIVGALLATNAARIAAGEITLAAIGASASFIHARAAELALANGPLSASDVSARISQAIHELNKSVL